MADKELKTSDDVLMQEIYAIQNEDGGLPNGEPLAGQGCTVAYGEPGWYGTVDIEPIRDNGDGTKSLKLTASMVSRREEALAKNPSERDPVEQKLAAMSIVQDYVPIDPPGLS